MSKAATVSSVPAAPSLARREQGRSSLVRPCSFFFRTKAERELRHDPRPSLEERYSGRAQYLEKIEAAARGLAAHGYLLDADIPAVVEHSATEWDYLNHAP